MKATFYSTSNFEIVEEAIHFRYPSNQMTVDKADMTIVFHGADPDFQTRSLLADYGADLED